MSTSPFLIGGAGGAYLFAEPGPLVLDIEKRDRHIHNRATHLRALLVSPDRRVVAEAVIPDDGGERGSGLGAPGRAQLSTTVAHRGVYALNITLSEDRYGDEVVWGFTTNCPKVLIETSRGHRDARHMEPIVLHNPGAPGDVCFLPRPAALAVEVTDLPASVSTVAIYDHAGTLLQAIPVHDRKASYTFPADPARGDRPWRLHVADQQAVIHVDGLTRWDDGDPYPDLSLWATSVGAFFPFHDARWLLTPYRRRAHTGDPESHELTFHVHNNGRRPDTVRLAVEGPSPGLSAGLSDNALTLAPGQSLPVKLRLSAPASSGPLSLRLRASSSTHEGFSTWSSVDLLPGRAQVAFEPPIVLKPYEHQNELHGILFDVPLDNQVYFAPDNRPFIRINDGIRRRDDDGTWRTLDTVQGVRYPAITTKVAFGGNGEICLIGRSDQGTAYLCSADGGNTFTAAALPSREGRRQQYDIEQPGGANQPKGLAPFVRVTETGEYDPKYFWRHVNDLELFLPRVEAGKVTVGEPILLATKALGVSSHSGIPSAIVSRGDRVHVTWGEATDPEDKSIPGVPAYIVTYDRKQGLLGEPAFVGWGPPANDVHNTPSVVLDGKGHLHTLTGTHGQPFEYARSLEPNTAHAGFTKPEPVSPDLRSTYIGFVCTPDDAIHIVFRYWTGDGVHHPHSYYANLGYMRKRPGQPWEKARRLVVAPFTEYSIWYHRLTVDRKGRLFLSYDYWSTYWFYRTDHRGERRGSSPRPEGGERRALMMSPDGGDTWRHVRNSDF